MEFRQIDLKTGQELPLPAKTVEHSYLELKIGKDIELSKLAVGKMYDGITEKDIERLQEQGLYLNSCQWSKCLLWRSPDCRKGKPRNLHQSQRCRRLW